MSDLGTAPASLATATVGSPEFRSFMSTFPTGVGIVTTLDSGDDRPWGMTCSSICSVSVGPPILLVCLRQGSPTLAALLLRSTFAVNLLHEQARPVAELFASGDPDRFDRVAWKAPAGSGGPHLYCDAHAVAYCRVLRHDSIGDHTVVFGEVYEVGLTEGEVSPLLYGRRRYATWPPDLAPDGAG